MSTKKTFYGHYIIQTISHIENFKNGIIYEMHFIL